MPNTFFYQKVLTKSTQCSKNASQFSASCKQSNQTNVKLIMKMFPKVITGVVGVTAALALSAQAQVIVDPNFSGPYTANPITVAGVNQGWAPFSAGLIATSPTYNGDSDFLGLGLGCQRWLGHSRRLSNRQRRHSGPKVYGQCVGLPDSGCHNGGWASSAWL